MISMAQVAFDTLAYANRLKKAGVKAEVAEVQAELHAEVLTDLIRDRLVTKDDLSKLENRLVLKLGGIVAAAVAILGTLMKIMPQLH